ncbi:MAG: SRPBCC domain-containing protein [Vicinamibacterales bacterium]
MEREHVSRASIEIAASNADVWDALVTPATAKRYFFGAEVRSDWKAGSPITFTGSFDGTSYHEKGTILQCQPGRLLQYSHWSDLEQLPDLQENYRHWTFRIEPAGPGVVLSVVEDNIPDETKRARSDEFWSGVLTTIKRIVETR